MIRIWKQSTKVLAVAKSQRFCLPLNNATKVLFARCKSSQISAAGFNDYEFERENFRLPVPEYYNFATDVIDIWAEAERVKLMTT